jgi:hypothetical protein
MFAWVHAELAMIARNFHRAAPVWFFRCLQGTTEVRLCTMGGQPNLTLTLRAKKWGISRVCDTVRIIVEPVTFTASSNASSGGTTTRVDVSVTQSTQLPCYSMLPAPVKIRDLSCHDNSSLIALKKEREPNRGCISQTIKGICRVTRM